MKRAIWLLLIGILPPPWCRMSQYAQQVVPHVPRLRRYSRALLKNAERAEDLSQEPSFIVYVRRIAGQPGFTDFQYRELGDLHVFYWIDKAMGYAVTGEPPVARLTAVANAVHSAMKPVAGP